MIDTKSALTLFGQFRFDNAYNNGFQDVPWEFDAQGTVSLVSLPFNQAPADAYPNTSPVSIGTFVPPNNAGAQEWVELNGDGAVEAGGGMNYQLPQGTSNWLLDIDGDVGVSLIPKGASIPLGLGQSPQQYAQTVQNQANNWTIVGSVTGQICLNIPTVAAPCATGAGAISNNGVAGCVSVSLPGTTELETLANGFDATVNEAAVLAETLAANAAPVVDQLGSDATTYTDDTGAASGDVLPTNVVVPSVNYDLGAVYYWSGSAAPLTTCSNQALVSAVSARDEARIAAARGVPSLQVRVRHSGVAPRPFVITGTTAAPDVIVVGPDRRVIRTKGPGFVTPGWIMEKDQQLKKTYVWAVDAPGGKWDFLAVPHSSRILRVQTAAGMPTPVVTAAVTGERKHAYVVRYHVADCAASDTIMLEETDGTGAPIPIATLRRSHGTIDWKPSATLFRPVRALLAVIMRHGAVVSASPLLGVNLKTHEVIKPTTKTKTRTGKRKHK